MAAPCFLTGTCGAVPAVAAQPAISEDRETRDTAARSEHEPFRVMTFNIRFDNPGDGEHVWANRRDKVASMLRLHQADIAGLQEALRNQIDELAKLLPQYEWMGVGRSDGKDGGEFTPIFYRRDRFDVLDRGDFWLSETADKPGSKSWDSALPRIVTWARFRDKASKREFYVYNTHFDHLGLRARLESAELLRERAEAAAKETPVIVMGDFNCIEQSPPYWWLTGRMTPEVLQEVERAYETKQSLESIATKLIPKEDAVLRDAKTVSKHGHHGPMTTWNGFRALVPGRKIDHIFVTSRVNVLQHAILADHWDGKFPSDHLPVLVEVTVSSPREEVSADG